MEDEPYTENGQGPADAVSSIRLELCIYLANSAGDGVVSPACSSSFARLIEFNHRIIIRRDGFYGLLAGDL